MGGKSWTCGLFCIALELRIVFTFLKVVKEIPQKTQTNIQQRPDNLDLQRLKYLLSGLYRKSFLTPTLEQK